MDEAQWQQLREEQLAQLKSDSIRYGFPVDVVGTVFHFHTPKGMLTASIVSLTYGDDGLPLLGVSNLVHRDWRLDVLYPVTDQRRNLWVLRCRSLDGKEREDYEGVVTFTH
jgi:hypothetical protein